MKILLRLLTLLQRKRAASRFGLTFQRAAKWKIPEQIIFRNKVFPIESPRDIGSDNAFLDVFIEDCYDIKSLKSGQINNILDIGGHVGLFSAFARLNFPNAKIHCYEPNPDLRPFLKAQMTNFNFDFFGEAVGLAEGKVTLVEKGDSVHTVSVNDADGMIAKTSFCDVVKRLNGRIDILKMDCEGAEWELFDADQACWNLINIVTMEYHLIKNYTEKDVAARLESLGFTVLRLEKTGPSWGLLFAKRVL